MPTFARRGQDAGHGGVDIGGIGRALGSGRLNRWGGGDTRPKGCQKRKPDQIPRSHGCLSLPHGAARSYDGTTALCSPNRARARPKGRSGADLYGRRSLAEHLSDLAPGIDHRPARENDPINGLTKKNGAICLTFWRKHHFAKVTELVARSIPAPGAILFNSLSEEASVWFRVFSFGTPFGAPPKTTCIEFRCSGLSITGICKRTSNRRSECWRAAGPFQLQSAAAAYTKPAFH